MDKQTTLKSNLKQFLSAQEIVTMRSAIQRGIRHHRNVVNGELYGHIYSRNRLVELRYILSELDK